MKISTRCRYALRMMIDISEQGEGECITIKDISKRQEISMKYLEQIVTNLTRAGLLRGIRGSQGGYILTKPPEKYTVGEILRAIEGNFAPVACLETEENLCERKDVCKTLGFWSGLYKVIDDYMDSITLSELVDKNKSLDYGV